MDKGTMSALFNYSYRATGRVLDAALQAGDETFGTHVADLNYFSMRGTLVHMLRAE